MDTQLLITCSIIFITAYLLGSIPNAVWIGKCFYKIDVREHGSKNAGATNVLRVLGKKAAIPVFLLDILKGYLAVRLVIFLPHLVGEWFTLVQIFLGILCVVGHIFPIFAGFKGGKGVATLVGIALALHPIGLILSFLLFVVILLITHYVSLGSLFGGLLFMLYTIFTPFPIWFGSIHHPSITLKIFSIFVVILLSVTHRKNIKRLLSGTENKTIFNKSK